MSESSMTQKNRELLRADRAKKPKTASEGGALWLDVLKVLPQIGWVIAGAWLLYEFSGPVLRALDQGNITKLGVGVLQIEVAQRQIQQAATAANQQIPINLKARIDRTPRILFDAAVLWLDDNPANNVSERRALASLGLTVDTARSTAEALRMLTGRAYQVVISDMRRVEAEPAPCVQLESSDNVGECDLISHLIHALERDNRGRETERASPPVIFYLRTFAPQQGPPPFSFGATARVDELFHLVLDALERQNFAGRNAKLQ